MRAKGYLVLISLMLMLAVPHLALAANPVHNFDCKNCHLSGYAINQLGGANVCLTCHGASPAMTQMNLRGPAVSGGSFIVGDASNQYGNNPAPGDQTSHNWAATSINKAAGAAEPNRTLHPGFYSRYGTTVGKVACSRCHNPHGELDTNPKLLPLVNPRLPTPMTPNDMCKACHQDFAGAMSAPANHGLLTHPLINDYPAFQAANSDRYKQVTATYNSATPYAAGVQLVDGAITCVTCHGLHATDSNAATANGFASTDLGAGDGLMLRGNGAQFTVTKPGMGTFPTGSSICNQCHNYEGSLHGPMSDIGCLACHGGHEYNDGTPNLFMLNDPTGSYAVNPLTYNAATFNRSAAWGGTGVGINGFCETCHGDLESGAWDGIRNHSANIGENCNTCHQDHSAGAFSEPLGCDGCHGSPPSVNAPGNAAFGAGFDPKGFAWVSPTHSYNSSTVLKDESLTPHSSHAGTTARYSYTCSVCHNTHLNDFAGTHNIGNNSFQDVLEAGHPFDAKAVAAGAANPSYTDPTGTCNTVYCHSNGGVNNGTGSRTFTFKAPTWENTKGTIVGQGTECSSCHGNSATNMGSATHDKHIAATGHAYGCNVCHVSTATSSTALVGLPATPPATHINQTVNVAFDTASPLKPGGAAVANGASPYSNPTSMTCSAVYCHSSGQSAPASRVYQTISWTTAGPLGCTACHDLSDPVTNQTAAHQAHVYGSGTAVARNLSCNVCHAGTATNATTLVAGANSATGKHVNGRVDVILPISLDINQDCSTSLCHSDGNIGSTSDFSGSGYNAKFNTPAWTTAPLNLGCDDCHGDGAGKSYPTYATGAAGGVDANSHVKHVAAAPAGSGISCGECHKDTSTDGTSIVGATGKHVNQVVDVALVTGSINGALTCSTTYCHGNGTPQWGGDVNCGDCHAANKTLAGSHAVHYNSALTGQYNIATINSSAGAYVFECGVCHSSTSGATPITHAGGPAIAGNAGAEVNFDGTIAEGTAIYNNGAVLGTDPNGFAYTAATCSNLYCHGNFGGNGNNATPVWGNAASGACGTCHDVDTTNPMAGGSHDRHVRVSGISCDFCHGATAVNAAGGISDHALHVDQFLNWKLDASKDQMTLSSTYGGSNAGTRAKAAVGITANYASCASVYCHSNVQAVPPAGLTGVTFSTPLWGGPAQCGSCHKGDTAGVEQDTASHLIHTDADQYGSRFGCSTCHEGAGSGTTKHADYAVDLVFNSTWGGSYSGTAAPGDAYGSCSANYCHSPGTDGTAPFTAAPNVVPTWNTTLTCASCHSATTTDTLTMATGSHGAHFMAANVGYEVACDKCHAATTTGMVINSYSNHVNKLVNVKFDGSLAAAGEVNRDSDSPTFNGASTTLANGATKAPGTVPGSCSNLYCHSTGNLDGPEGSLVPVTVSGAPVGFKSITWDSAAITCDGCHGDGAGKAHPVYNSGTLASTTANTHVKHVEDSGIGCDSCHISTTTTNTSLVAGGTHLDRIETVAFKSIGSKTGTYDNTVGIKSCSTTYCHGAGTPQWGGPTLNCSSCHNAGNDLADSHGLHYALAANTVNSASLTASNTSSGANYAFSCGVCHDSITHAGGPVLGQQTAEIEFAAALVNTATLGTPSYTRGADEGFVDNGFTYTRGTCSATYCHSDGNGAAGNITPQWNSATLNTECTACHDNNESATFAVVAGDRTMSTGAHAAHVTYNTTSVTACANCHSVTVSADRTILDKAYHVNRTKNVDIAAALDSDLISANNYNSGTGGCSNIYCHSPGQNSTGGPLGALDYATATWANPASGACGTCHAVTEGTGLTSGSHGEHLGTAGVNGCGDCHAGADNLAATYNSTNHVNRLIDVTNTYNAAGLPGNGYGTCSTASCHDDGTNTPAKTPRWGEAGGCASCHADDMTTGSHGEHLTTTLTTAVTISCDNCHGNTVKGFSAISDGVGAHLNGNVDVYNSVLNVGGTGFSDLGYNSANLKGNGYQSCSTTYCHGYSLKFSEDAGNTSPRWGDTTAGNCNSCHGFPPVQDTNGTNDTHPASTAAECTACHTHVNAAGDGFNNPALHIDGTVQVNGGSNCLDCHGNGKSYDPGGAHDNHTDVEAVLSARSLTNTPNDFGNPAYWYNVTYNASGLPQMGCGQCHHDEVNAHFTARVGGDVKLNPAGDTGIPTVNAKRFNYAASAYSTTTRTCSNVYCHSDGVDTNGVTDGGFGYAATPVWHDGTGTNPGIFTGDSCAACHGNSPGSNAHGVHEVGIHYEELYDVDGVGLMPASATVASGTVAAHGNPNYSTTINCFTCHSGTVANSANAGNITCAGCHSDTDSVITGNELARIAANSATHLNGAKDVTFADLTGYKSRAQLRDNLADADDGTNILSAIWNRIVGYKPAAGTGYDQVQAAFATPVYNSTLTTCSTAACHNGVTVAWNKQGNINPATYAPDCMACHTSLPK